MKGRCSCQKNPKSVFGMMNYLFSPHLVYPLMPVLKMHTSIVFQSMPLQY